MRNIRAGLNLPPRLDHPGLLVGWSLETEHRRHPIGFGFGDPAMSPATGYVDPILMEREGHLITIAPTGAGKGTGCIVPALLRFDGPVIVIDPKGENALITARQRRALGQEVVVIDPMGITGLDSGSINPMDLIDVRNENAVDEVMSLVAALTPAELSRNTQDGAYWQERGQAFVIGIILHVLADMPAKARHLGTVRKLVAQAIGELGQYVGVAEGRQPGTELHGTVLSAMEASRHPEAASIGRMLRMGAVSTLGGILSFSQSLLDFIRAGSIERATRRTSFDLGAVTRGDPLSIYLVMPPHMLDSHGRLLRLWIHTLFTLITSRNSRPAKSTLFILDEAAQLGRFDPLRRAVTLMRGYGLQTWSFWQDPSQLINLYPQDWQTMVNNCRAVQCFGANTMLAAQAMADMVGYAPAMDIVDLQDHEMLLQLSGDQPVIARLPNYLNDPAFVGLHDPNPFHDPDRPVVRNSTVQRVFDRSVHPDEDENDTAPEVPTPAEVLKRLRKA